MKAQERRCPDHDVTTTDLVGYSSNANAPVYRCVPPLAGDRGFHMPHYFTIGVIKDATETPKKKRTKKDASPEGA